MNRVRTIVREIGSSANKIEPKPSILLLSLINNSHDSEIILVIISPANQPRIVEVSVARHIGQTVVIRIGRSVIEEAGCGGRIAACRDSEVVCAGERGAFATYCLINLGWCLERREVGDLE